MVEDIVIEKGNVKLGKTILLKSDEFLNIIKESLKYNTLPATIFYIDGSGIPKTNLGSFITKRKIYFSPEKKQRKPVTFKSISDKDILIDNNKVTIDGKEYDVKKQYLLNKGDIKDSTDKRDTKMSLVILNKQLKGGSLEKLDIKINPFSFIFNEINISNKNWKYVNDCANKYINCMFTTLYKNNEITKFAILLYLKSPYLPLSTLWLLGDTKLFNTSELLEAENLYKNIDEKKLLNYHLNMNFDKLKTVYEEISQKISGGGNHNEQQFELFDELIEIDEKDEKLDSDENDKKLSRFDELILLIKEINQFKVSSIDKKEALYNFIKSNIIDKPNADKIKFMKYLSKGIKYNNENFIILPNFIRKYLKKINYHDIILNREIFILKIIGNSNLSNVFTYLECCTRNEMIEELLTDIEINTSVFLDFYMLNKCESGDICKNFI